MAKPHDPWLPKSTEDLRAIQAVNRGDATPEQQRRCMDILIQELGLLQAPSFVPGDTHATAFIEGRRWVALALGTAIKTTVAAYESLKPRKESK